MRAIATSDYGTPPCLTDLPKPEPGLGEVLVHVRASSINGFDGAVAAGMLKGMMEHRFPVVLGKDCDGGLGEYLVVGEQYGIARVPGGLSLQDAGALGLAGSAARDAVDAVAPAAGELVLVSGATGGVGALTLQYALAAGADVIATARSGAEEEFVRGLGATRVVDYGGDLAAQVRAIAPEGVPAIVHLVGDGAQLAGLLAPGRRIVSTLGFGRDQHPSAIAVMASPEAATLDRIAADVVSGALRVPITRTYPLEATPQALADFGAGTLGKLAVSV
jgi:NADPH:quinone reductase-like Zn-dependent oxidoreductase